MIGLDSFYKLKYIHRYTSNVRIHTENVAEHSLAVERSKQFEKANYQRPQKLKK